MISTATLRKVRIFDGLTDDQLSLLQSLLKLTKFSKGDYILKDETNGDTIYLLVEGKVKVTKELVKGIDVGKAEEKVLVTLDAAMFPTFGENGILGHAPRNANVIAATDCMLYYLSKADFDQITAQDVKAAFTITFNIARLLSDRLQSTDDNLVKLATALYIAVQR